MNFARYYLPGWLYKVLPYLYMAAGVLVMYWLENNWAIFSGVILLSAGAMVLGMRLWNGRILKDIGVEEKGSEVLQFELGDTGHLHLIWSKKYESGNSGIDAQHRGLFDMGNALLEATHNDRKQEEIVQLFDKLHDDIKSHFSSEEKLMEDWGHPLTEGHKKAHQGLLDKALEARVLVAVRRMSYREAVDFIVNELVLNHIAKEDVKFFKQV